MQGSDWDLQEWLVGVEKGTGELGRFGRESGLGIKRRYVIEAEKRRALLGKKKKCTT